MPKGQTDGRGKKLVCGTPKIITSPNEIQIFDSLKERNITIRTEHRITYYISR